MSNLEFRDYFDPLCGWCYASAPALAGLAERYGEKLSLRPVGLFVEPRPVSAIADHAWRNDQRIVGLTGQPFSEAYRDNVLLAPNGVYTSGPLTLALCALGESDPALEQRFLHAAQIARYVDGRDTSRVEEVVRVAQNVAAKASVAFDAVAFGARLQNDKALAEGVRHRIKAAKEEMQELPGNGVPQLVVMLGGRPHSVSSQTLYAGKDQLLSAIERILQAA